MIAQQLISLLPDSRPLSLIVRLIFCLKFPNEASRLTISTLTWTVKMKCTALPLLFNLSVGQLMTMAMFRLTLSQHLLQEQLTFMKAK